jgi:universal stress protein A
MEDYRHLLVAVDFAAETDQVVDRAVLLRDKCGARLSLVHVVEYVPMAYSGDLALPDDFNLEQELLDAARKRMAELGERLGIAEADRYVTLGSTPKEILRIVQEHQVDIVVVGSHGQHGIALLLGSTAGSILHHAECDLLAVRITQREKTLY